MVRWVGRLSGPILTKSDAFLWIVMKWKMCGVVPYGQPGLVLSWESGVFVLLWLYYWLQVEWCFLIFFRYHRLLELRYGDKHNKSLATKEWANKEGLSVREMEHHMDVEMFLSGHAGWEMGSPHCPIILHKMYQHALEQWWKEAEHMICWGHQHSLPELDQRWMSLPSN